MDMQEQSSLQTDLKNSWMAKNTTFDFNFIPNSYNAIDTPTGGTSSTTSTSNSSLSQEHEDRLLNLKRRFEDAIQIMIVTWDGTPITQNEEEKDDDNDDETDTSTNKESTTRSTQKEAKGRMVHHDTFVSKWFDKLVSLHCQKERAYHTLCHLEEMFGYIDFITTTRENASTILPPKIDSIHNAIISLSILFHDAIYDPKSASNEEDSLALYKSFENEFYHEIIKSKIQKMQQEPQQQNNNNDSSAQWFYSNQIATYILATKSHQIDDNIIINNKNNDTSIEFLKIFLDADMAVLGKEPNAYDHYASLIRQEYIHVPHDVYCEKRAEILQSFVKSVVVDDDKNGNKDEAKGETDDNVIVMNKEQPQKKIKRNIYASEIMYNALEERAIENLQREINMLKMGRIPKYIGEVSE